MNKGLKWLAGTRFGKWRIKVFTKRVRSLCYTSISKLPIQNWWALNEGNLESLYKDETRDIGKGHKYILSKLSKELYDQFFKEFGFGEKMTEIIEKNRQITLLYLEKVRDNNDMLLTDIEIAEKELLNLQKKNLGAPVNLVEIIAGIESILHVTIDMERCSTEKFYGYLKLLEKRNNKNG